MTRNYIVMTAAVIADPRIGSAVLDPGRRLEEYRGAVRRWRLAAKQTGFTLVLVETSGSTALEDEVRSISYTPTDEQLTRGKGAAEAAALDHALMSLNLEREATVVKVTGRLFVENAVRLLKPVVPNHASVRRSLDRRYCDSRFFSTTAGFWLDHLAGMGEDVNDAVGRYLEHSLGFRLIGAEFVGGATIDSFPVRPLIVGQSGSAGTRYGTAIDRLRGPLLGPAERLARGFARKQV